MMIIDYVSLLMKVISSRYFPWPINFIIIIVILIGIIITMVFIIVNLHWCHHHCHPHPIMAMSKLRRRITSRAMNRNQWIFPEETAQKQIDREIQWGKASVFFGALIIILYLRLRKLSISPIKI